METPKLSLSSLQNILAASYSVNICVFCLGFLCQTRVDEQVSGFCPVTITFIYFKLCVYIYINLFILAFIYLLLGWHELTSAFAFATVM